MTKQIDNVKSVLHDASTKALVDELRTRIGVSETTVEPYEHDEVPVDGPAIVLTVID